MKNIENITKSIISTVLLKKIELLSLFFIVNFSETPIFDLLSILKKHRNYKIHN